METKWEDTSHPTGPLESLDCCSLSPVTCRSFSFCPRKLLTLLLEFLGEGGAEGVAITQGDKAVEAFALHGMRVAHHSCLCHSLMFYKCRFHLCCTQKMSLSREGKCVRGISALPCPSSCSICTHRSDLIWSNKEGFHSLFPWHTSEHVLTTLEPLLAYPRVHYTFAPQPGARTE